MKRTAIRAAFLLTILLILLPCAVFAEETLTELDPFSDESGVSSSDAAASGNASKDTLIWVGGSTYYSEEHVAFAYDLSAAAPATLYSSVASKMITTNPVSITIPGGVTAMLYRNGILVENPNFSEITETGSYVLSLSGNSVKTIEPLSFTIAAPVSGKLDFYTMPSGFTIQNVTKDGEPVSFLPLEADFAEEGDYCVTYRCDALGTLYELRVTIDHTAPVLELNEVKDGVAHGPVSIADLEEGVNIRIILDGTELPYSKTLPNIGNYTIILTDEAGNSNVYQFTIMVYLNLSSYLFIGLFALVLILISGYLLFTRKRLRVR